MHPDWYWVLPFTIIDSLNRVFYGMYGTLIGPSQPYFAQAVNVDIDTVNWMSPIGSVFGISGAVISSCIFKKYFVTSQQKLRYLICLSLLMAFTAVLPPYSRSFEGLIFVVSLRAFIGQMLEIPCQGIYIHTMGPERSQSLIMLFHCTVGFGFLLGPLIIRPFFPEQTLAEHEEVCNPDLQHHLNPVSLNRSLDLNQIEEIDVNVLDSIKWPYWIVMYGHLISCLGYLAVMMLPYKMPVFEENQKKSDADNRQTIKTTTVATCCPSDICTIMTICILYMSSCGSERLFQTLGFTFALCGPLQLPAKMAVLNDQFYNGGFMVGRSLSIVIVNLISPKMMLKLSIVLCLISTMLLSWKGGQSSNLLFSCAALFGVAISWQYGAAFSWAAQYMDVVGPRASIFTLGCGLSAFSPVIGAYLFHRVTPMALWHFNLVQVLTQLMAFTMLHILYKNTTMILPDHGSRTKSKKNTGAGDYSYSELNQLEEINLSSEDDIL